MRLILLACLSVSLLVLASCARLPFFSRSQHSRSSVKHESLEPAKVLLELQNSTFDGQLFSGRLLISPVGGSLRVDKRMIESFALSVKDVSSCDTGEPLEYIVTDVLAPPLSEEDIFILQPGYWYGKQIRLRLFDAAGEGQPLPECFEADLIYHALDVKFASRTHVRAQRPRPQTMDAGVQSDAADAGTP